MFIRGPPKVHTKCSQNRECDFINASTSITYDFSALKCLNFADALSLLGIGGQSLGTDFRDARLRRTVAHYPFSFGEKVRMRDKPVHSGAVRPLGTTCSYCTEGEIMRHFPKLKKVTRCCPGTCGDTCRPRLILNFIEIASLTSKRMRRHETIRTNPDDFRKCGHATLAPQALTSGPPRIVRMFPDLCRGCLRGNDAF